METVLQTSNKKTYGSIDIAKLVFAVSVVYIHTGLQVNAISNTILSSIVNSFNSIAVPFFFISSGFFFFGKVDSLDDKNAYIKSYFSKTIRMYTIWSLLIWPFRIIQNGDNAVVSVLKFLRIYIFIGDGQLWYLHALILGILYILILRKCGIKDNVILAVSFILFAIGRFIDPYVSSAAADSTGILKIYYIFWGASTKTGLLMGMFYAGIGCYFSKFKIMVKQITRLLPCLGISIFLFVMLAYCNKNEIFAKHFVLPALAIATFCLLINISEKTRVGGVSLRFIRDVSTVIYLCHYVFVRLFNTVDSLGQIFPGMSRFLAVLVLSMLTATVIVMAGRKYKLLRMLW